MQKLISPDISPGSSTGTCFEFETVIPDARIDLALTLVDSAQCFHFARRGDAVVGVSMGSPVRLRQTPEGLRMSADAASAARWVRYLDLERDYDAVFEGCEGDPLLSDAARRLPGLRVLNQPPWEALLAFLLSSNNNVSRIRSLVLALSRAYGATLELGGETLYALPEPVALARAGEAALRALGCGYRAAYIARSARMVCEGFPLDELAFLPYEEARAQLLRLPGVGPKVADCVLLFGCGHSSAFPVDVWVERIMTAYYLPGLSRARVAERARALWGPYAGLRQQYLFHLARTGALPGLQTARKGGERA